MVNALVLCKGKFTRVRTQQKQFLTFFILCNQTLPSVSLMKVDEIGEFQMARYKGKTVKSDHNMLKLEIDLEFHKERKHDKMDAFNVRNKLNQERFCEFTSKDTRLSECFSPKNKSFIYS